MHSQDTQKTHTVICDSLLRGGYNHSQIVQKIHKNDLLNYCKMCVSKLLISSELVMNKDLL